MMMLRSRAACSILVALSMLAAVLAACRGNDEAERAENQLEQPPSAIANNGVHESGASEGKKPEDYSGTITLWGWDHNYYETTFAAFQKKYPHIKLEVTNVAARDYLQKLQTTLVSGGELPDLLVGEMDWRGRAFQLDIWENLEAAPYHFDRNLIFGYLPALNSKPNGEIVTIEQSVSPAALAYRRDLAKEYFGTDDPEELEAMFPTWDAIIEKGKEVRQKSGGKVFMFASTGELYNLFVGQNHSALLQNGELDVTGRVKDALMSIIRMRDAGIVDRLQLWSPQWNASIARGHHIFYAAANWSPQSNIKPNDPAGSGRWGLMMPPGGPFSWGGTAFGINKDSKNKQLAWAFIEWLLLTKEGAEISKTFNYIIPLKSVYEDAGFVSAVDPYFGGQDVGRFWMERAVPNLKLPTISEYDSLLTASAKVALNVLNADPEATLEDVLPKILGEVQAKMPDLKVN
ncbi:ABC transporter substrate-binding protein [Paenibacillus arenilitoris]|uniref:Extracellular solute-binding protein n=1 Tax=Paenibacillus arenilitoris TaxID=2772299 RepID=A0A927CKR4_9BACL|nr:extracellular solute-binding protein [Paenibacillus arenilitoris]MBD2868977.1 extracellular solute-binding protein [Paenibacillus arenilitoris]